MLNKFRYSLNLAVDSAEGEEWHVDECAEARKIGAYGWQWTIWKENRNLWMAVNNMEGKSELCIFADDSEHIRQGKYSKNYIWQWTH